MRNSLPPTFLLLALVGVLTCCIATELKVTNRTGGSIQFYSGHTKKAVQIPDGGTVTVPHTAGRVIVITQQDEVWEYDAVSIGDFPSATSKGFKRLTLALTVEAGGTITLPSGQKVNTSQRLKPNK